MTTYLCIRNKKKIKILQTKNLRRQRGPEILKANLLIKLLFKIFVWQIGKTI